VDWKTLNSGGGVARPDGSRLILLDGKPVVVTPTQWTDLTKGKVISSGTKKIAAPAGRPVVVDDADWAALKDSKPVIIDQHRYVLIDDNLTEINTADWKTLTDGDAILRFDGKHLILIDGKTVIIAQSDWSDLAAGKIVTASGGEKIVLEQGKVFGFTPSEWQKMQAGDTLGRFGRPVGIVNGKFIWIDYGSNYPAHMTAGHGINGDRISGAHNLNSFEQVYLDLGLNPSDGIIQKSSTVQPGIFVIKYRVPDVVDGTVVDPNPAHWTEAGFPKTVYDPAAVSDADMLKWSQEAMANAKLYDSSTGLYVGTASNGIVFRGYLNGRGVFSTVYPFSEGTIPV